VYNDIYDTLQGTDRINVNRNPFSGGSSVLQNAPHLLPVMSKIARLGLGSAFLATVVLTFLIDQSLWNYLWLLFLLSAFFSKYYTAAKRNVLLHLSFSLLFSLGVFLTIFLR
jgi:hypothetical protein